MGSTIEVLTRQHQDVLAWLAATETALASGRDDADLAGFANFLDSEVVQHFALEEHALFPILARHPGLSQGPLAVMNAEHASFRELLNNLTAGIRAADLGQQRSCTHGLIDLLRAHIAKEDTVLFPMASRLLSADELAEVEARAAELAGESTAAQPQT
jgi:hemerythrin-like domain-containing protein